MSSEVVIKAKEARIAARKLANVSTDVKNKALETIAHALEVSYERILVENKKDIDRARQRGMSPAMIDRLTLTKERVLSMAEGVRQVASRRSGWSYSFGTTASQWVVD